MKETPIASIVMFLIAAVVGAFGQYLYKAGADSAGSTWQSYVLNVRLVAGVICYIVVMVLFVAAFKTGGSLSVLYPLYASTFIWGAVIARFAYKEPIHITNYLGMAVLVLGMWLMGIGK